MLHRFMWIWSNSQGGANKGKGSIKSTFTLLNFFFRHSPSVMHPSTANLLSQTFSSITASCTFIASREGAMGRWASGWMLCCFLIYLFSTSVIKVAVAINWKCFIYTPAKFIVRYGALFRPPDSGFKLTASDRSEIWGWKFSRGESSTLHPLIGAN